MNTKTFIYLHLIFTKRTRITYQNKANNTQYTGTYIFMAYQKVIKS